MSWRRVVAAVLPAAVLTACLPPTGAPADLVAPTSIAASPTPAPAATLVVATAPMPAAATATPPATGAGPGATTPTPTGGPATMPKGIVSGALPPGFQMARDTDPLPPEALVKFQVISRGPNPRNNLRWVLYLDGRFFLAGHSGRVANPALPFDVPLPALPTRTLSASQVAQVEARLRSADFPHQPPYQARPNVEDGTYYIVTARLAGETHEVIYEAYSPPLVTYLEQLGAE